MKNNTLILDYSKWRSGGNLCNENGIGKGTTLLLNEEGYMCCLGQFGLQLSTKITEEDINGMGCISGTDKRVLLLTHHNKGYIDDTRLACDAMRINDDCTTTPQFKIQALRKLFGKKGFKIKVINKPE